MHEGHRNRLKERFLQEGLEHFTSEEVLELLLFYAVPRQDTKPIAQRLLSHFGSLSAVLEAPPLELTNVAGIGTHAATFLTLVTAASRFYLMDRTADCTILQEISQCADYLSPRFYGLREEQVYILCLDAKCKLLLCRCMGQGSVNTASVPIRRIVEAALSANATSLVLAHNHISGITQPSHEDYAATDRLKQALDAVGIILADHLIFADHDYISLFANSTMQTQY